MELSKKTPDDFKKEIIEKNIVAYKRIDMEIKVAILEQLIIMNERTKGQK